MNIDFLSTQNVKTQRFIPTPSTLICLQVHKAKASQLSIFHCPFSIFTCFSLMSLSE